MYIHMCVCIYICIHTHTHTQPTHTHINIHTHIPHCFRSMPLLLMPIQLFDYHFHCVSLLVFLFHCCC